MHITRNWSCSLPESASAPFNEESVLFLSEVFVEHDSKWFSRVSHVKLKPVADIWYLSNLERAD
ncbi:hypothetical protein INS49_012656 [Diaporthe citri]|uniref:uncharacterized protein n=1 Tax=Diaporthe citri TaxID=83186 RepID=UPI001C812F46|nr:uncharacterized protein INS49_012656 [Diaporthe citri]KAG6359136.1 hypothetical protein INS49_012656 [Diaporthe citri]